MKYTVLDLENPNSKQNSICAVALVTVEDGEIIEEWYELINPEDQFDRRNIEINGIDPAQVQNAPTFPEVWTDVCKRISNTIIVGHNIQYDLNVLKKTANRYGYQLPLIKFFCTLQLSQMYMQSDSYKLSNLCERIGYHYEAHNAREDALACNELFKKLLPCVTDNEIQEFEDTSIDLIDSINDKLINNINEFNGMVQGILADGKVETKEINQLLEWNKANQVNRNYAIFNRICSIIEEITVDGVIDYYELSVLRGLTSCIKSSKVYSETTLGIQQLLGMLEGIICDNVLEDSEVMALNSWLIENDYLDGVYPYNKLMNCIHGILEDGKITEDEKNELMSSINDILHPTQSSESVYQINGKTFCLTGDFLFGSKEMVSNKLSSLGGIEKKGVSKKVDFLFVGAAGSAAWKYGTAGGGKIKAAQELQEKGSSIQIIAECDMGGLLND